MLTNSQSHWLLILLKFRNGFTVPFPISLFILNDLLEATNDLISFIEWLIPKQKNTSIKFFHYHEKIIELINLLKELLNTLCNYGKWEMVDVENDDIKVAIKFF